MKIRKIASKIYKQNKIGKGEVSEKLGHHQLWSSLVCLQVQDIRETGLGRRWQGLHGEGHAERAEKCLYSSQGRLRWPNVLSWAEDRRRMDSSDSVHGKDMSGVSNWSVKVEEDDERRSQAGTLVRYNTSMAGSQTIYQPSRVLFPSSRAKMSHRALSPDLLPRKASLEDWKQMKAARQKLHWRFWSPCCTAVLPCLCLAHGESSEKKEERAKMKENWRIQIWLLIWQFIMWLFL